MIFSQSILLIIHFIVEICHLTDDYSSVIFNDVKAWLFGIEIVDIGASIQSIDVIQSAPMKKPGFNGSDIDEMTVTLLMKWWPLLIDGNFDLMMLLLKGKTFTFDRPFGDIDRWRPMTDRGVFIVSFVDWYLSIRCTAWWRCWWLLTDSSWWWWCWPVMLMLMLTDIIDIQCLLLFSIWYLNETLCHCIWYYCIYSFIYCVSLWQCVNNGPGKIFIYFNDIVGIQYWWLTTPFVDDIVVVDLEPRWYWRSMLKSTVVMTLIFIWYCCCCYWWPMTSIDWYCWYWHRLSIQWHCQWRYWRKLLLLLADSPAIGLINEMTQCNGPVVVLKILLLTPLKPNYY